jgi:integrase
MIKEGTMASEKKPRREKGTGSVYQVGRRWFAQYRHPDGSLKRESASSKTEAGRLLRKRIGARDSGLPVVPYAERTTFEDAVVMIRDDFSVGGKKSWDDVDRRIRLHLTPTFGGRRLVGIRSDDTVRYAAARQTAGASAGQINRELQILKRMLSLAVRHGRLASRPHIAMLKEPPARSGFFDAEQVDAVCRRLEPDIADVVRFAFITGWRVASEVLPLQWRQIDFNGGEVRLDAGTTKNGEPRVFPMSAQLRTLLLRRYGQHEKLRKAGHIEPWVFWRMVAQGRGGKKKPQPIVAFSKQWKAACKGAGCPGRIPHDLRRSAVRTFVRVGIPERVAMQLTGHKTRSVFERYNITSEGDLRDAARKLDQFNPAISSKEQQA